MSERFYISRKKDTHENSDWERDEGNFKGIYGGEMAPV